MALRREVHAELEELKDDLARGEGSRGTVASKAVPNPDDNAEPSGLRLQHLLGRRPGIGPVREKSGAPHRKPFHG